MKIVSQDGAVASVAFIPDEVKPLKGFHLPVLLKAVSDRYEATRSPTIEQARSEGAKYQNCLFKKGSKEIAIAQIGMFNDTFSVTTTDTEDAQIVLDDLIAWLKAEFKFRDPTTPPVSMYQSDLVVRFSNDPADAFGYLKNFLEAIQREMTPKNVAIPKKEVMFSAIAFGTDPIGPGATPEFTLARRLHVPWNLNIYFTKAHMRTKAHIKALELLDKLIEKK